MGQCFNAPLRHHPFHKYFSPSHPVHAVRGTALLRVPVGCHVMTFRDRPAAMAPVGLLFPDIDTERMKAEST